MGSDESHLNASVGSDGQSHKTVSTNRNLSEEKGEPKRYRTEVLPLISLTPYRYAKPAHKPSFPPVSRLCAQIRDCFVRIGSERSATAHNWWKPELFCFNLQNIAKRMGSEIRTLRVWLYIWCQNLNRQQQKQQQQQNSWLCVFSARIRRRRREEKRKKERKKAGARSRCIPELLALKGLIHITRRLLTQSSEWNCKTLPLFSLFVF